MEPKPDRTDDEDAETSARDVLSGFNAEEILEDPDRLRPPEQGPPAPTPDSPNPIYRTSSC